MNNLQLAYASFLIQHEEYKNISSFDVAVNFAVGRNLKLNIKTLCDTVNSHKKSGGLLLTPINDKNVLKFLSIISNSFNSELDSCFKTIFNRIIDGRENELLPIKLYDIKLDSKNSISNYYLPKNIYGICVNHISGKNYIFVKPLSDIIYYFNVLKYLTFI